MPPFDPTTARPADVFDPATARPVAAPPESMLHALTHHSLLDMIPLRDAAGAVSQAGNWLTAGAYPSLTGVTSAALAPLMGRDPGAEFQRQKAATQSIQQDFQQRRPLAAAALATAGGALPMLATGGMAAPEEIAANASTNLTRTPLQNFARQAGTGAVVNGAASAVNAIGAPDFGGQVMGGMAGGAVLGPVAARLSSMALPALDATAGRVADMVGRIRPRANALGALGGGVDLAPASQTTRDAVRSNLMTLARRARLTPEDVTATQAAHTEAGTQPLMAQVLGEPGLSRARTLAAVPGQTPTLAADVLRARQRGQSEGVGQLFDQALPSTTPLQAGKELDQALGNASMTNFGPALAQQANPAHAARINGLLARFPDSVLQRSQHAIENLASIDGVDPNAMSSAQRLYYTKRALGDTIESMSREGLGSDQVRALTRLQGQYVNALQDAVPGLRGAMAEWADLKGSQEALGMGQQVMQQRTEDLAGWAQKASPTQRHYAEVGLRDWAQTQLERNRDGRSNIAELFATDAFRNRVQALIGPDRAAPLLRALRTRSQDFRDAQSMMPRAGSPTAPIFADLLDHVAAMPPTKHGVVHAVTSGLWRAATNPLLEHGRNLEGRELFATLTPQRAQVLRAALLKAGIKPTALQSTLPLLSATRQNGQLGAP